MNYNISLLPDLTIGAYNRAQSFGGEGKAERATIAKASLSKIFIEVHRC